MHGRLPEQARQITTEVRQEARQEEVQAAAVIRHRTMILRKDLPMPTTGDSLSDHIVIAIQVRNIPNGSRHPITEVRTRRVAYRLYLPENIEK
jgi:hypothetical protein